MYNIMQTFKNKPDVYIMWIIIILFCIHILFNIYNKFFDKSNYEVELLSL